MCINTSDFFHAFSSYPREARSSGIACAPGSPPPRRRRPGARRGAKPPRHRGPILRDAPRPRRALPPPHRGLGLGPGPATGAGLGGGGVAALLGSCLRGFFTAPGGYLAFRLPRGQFAAPKRSWGFEANTANKISMTLITPRMNISFT